MLHFTTACHCLLWSWLSAPHTVLADGDRRTQSVPWRVSTAAVCMAYFAFWVVVGRGRSRPAVLIRGVKCALEGVSSRPLCPPASLLPVMSETVQLSLPALDTFSPSLPAALHQHGRRPKPSCFPRSFCPQLPVVSLPCSPQQQGGGSSIRGRRRRQEGASGADASGSQGSGGRQGGGQRRRSGGQAGGSSSSSRR